MKELELQQALRYIKAGKSTFTIQNKKTGNRFTYQVNKSKTAKIPLYFVSLMTGSNNESDFTYIGFIKNDTFIYGNKSRINNEAIGVKAFTSVYSLFEKGVFHKDLAFYHEGCCGKCGRKLTTPGSVERGYGPECAGRI